ncbi:MAG: N-acetylmuramoyl-L-alanine amidase [Candidatus Aureabacteria bacterium]|nr:N-acetylmuramoyl-L-alanine amidase [Candidatus Auribacterota bacterium]
MKYLFSLLFSLMIAAVTALAAHTPKINIVYPRKKQVVKAAEKTFIFGHVSPAQGVLTINGQKVKIHPSGGFLATLPVKPGIFIFDCKLVLSDGSSARLKHPIQIPFPRRKRTTQLPMIETTDLYPDTSLGVLPGEEVFFKCKTMPDKKVVCRIGDIQTFSLYEQEKKKGVRGIYQATKSFDGPFYQNSITFLVTDDSRIKPLLLPVTLTVLPLPEYPVVEVLQDKCKARFKPNGGYDTFLEKGSLLKCTGFMGKWLRCALSRNHPVYVERKLVTDKIKGKKIFSKFLGNLSVSEKEDRLLIKIATDRNLNHSWIEYPDTNKLGIKFFKVTTNIDRMVPQVNVSSLKDITWSQLEEDVALIDFYLNFSPQWGYSLDYKNTHAILTIRKTLEKKLPKEIIICLDAGHGGADLGAIGPTGKTEADMNLKQTLVVGKCLEEQGYQVIYTRKTNQTLPLDQRAPFAISSRADIFISIHHNAPADGCDPYLQRATETYYYNRSGKKLGQYLHPFLMKATGLKNGSLRFGNLAVCRHSGMASVLLEIDYLVIPEVEERVQKASFRTSVAQAICNGIDSYLNQR